MQKSYFWSWFNQNREAPCNAFAGCFLCVKVSEHAVKKLQEEYERLNHLVEDGKRFFTWREQETLTEGEEE